MHWSVINASMLASSSCRIAVHIDNCDGKFTQVFANLLLISPIGSVMNFDTAPIGRKVAMQSAQLSVEAGGVTLRRQRR